MKKKLLILHPSKFTEFYYYKYELSYFEKKNYEIIIHDLSNISYSKQYNKLWKTKKEKKAIRFFSLLSWINEFNKIRKKKNIFIYDFLDYGEINFKIFIIKSFLKYSKFPILKYEIKDVAYWKPKKNFKFFLNKIFEHKLNFNLQLFTIKEKFFTLLMKFIKFNKIFLLTNKNQNGYKDSKNISLVKFHSFDFSNSLIEKKKNFNKKNNRRYIVYLDNGRPYFPGDAVYMGRKLLNIDAKDWYKDLNLFFDKIEKFFKAKIIIIPHQKYKIKSLKKKKFKPLF